MRVLVTGGLGHIGSRLIRVLGEQAQVTTVRILDNLSTQRYASLFNLPEGGRYEFLEGDILDADAMGAAVRGIDCVVHLAAVTDAEGSFAIQEHVQRVNLEGTKRVVAACQHAGVRQLIFPSTTSVYGPRSGLAREDCGPEELHPQSPYAQSKLAAESVIREATRPGALQGCVFRFGTIFGQSPGMRFHTAVNKFIYLACLGRPLTVWKQALHQRRPYLDLEDAIDAIRFALEHPDRVGGECFNVVTLNATVHEIVSVIRSHLPDLQIQLTDSPVLNQHSYEADPTKFQAQGFRYVGNLERGVSETIALLRAVTRTRRTEVMA